MTQTVADADAATRAAIDSVPTGLFIGGQWRDTAARTPVVDPATGQTLCTVADAGPQDGLDALAAAAAAQSDWAATPARTRSEILQRAHRALLDDTERLARIATAEMGKPLAEARGEIAYAAEFFRWFAEEAVRIDGGYMPAPAGGSRFLVTRQPVGPSLLITPWNFPMAMGTRKIGPALAAGCTSVVKPAEQTPLCTLALAEILSAAGVPDGVVNVVTTSDPATVIGAMIADSRSRKLSFTGSTAVGKLLLEQCAQRVHAHLDGTGRQRTVHRLRRRRSRRGGRGRAAGEDAQHRRRRAPPPTASTCSGRWPTEFAAPARGADGGTAVGRGTDDGVVVGPLIDAAPRQGHGAGRRCPPARRHGAYSAGPRDGAGLLLSATVLTDVPDEAGMFATEIFGPVAPI